MIIPGVRVAGIVDQLLAAPHSAGLLAAYVDAEAVFAGELFDTLGTSTPCHISTDDLLAVSLLDVRFAPMSVRAILDTQAEGISMRLAAIDDDVPIWEAKDDLLDEALTDLWTLLRAIPGMGPVKTSKLLARKRPHLVPIFDSVVMRMLGIGYQGSWRIIREVLADRERRARLASLQPETSLSVLRLLDILIWMHGSESTSARRTRASVGMSVQPRTT